MLAFVLTSIALVALALAFVLPALWTDARRAAMVMLLAFPIGAFGLYAFFGTPDGLDPTQREIPESIEQAVAQLERRLEREPDSFEGWVLLARTRKGLGRNLQEAGDVTGALSIFAGAVDAYRKANALAPEDPDLKVEMAEALSLANAERRFGAEAIALLDAALRTSPVHARALWFRGIASLQAGDAADAAARWEFLLPSVDEATAKALREQIAGARAVAGLPPIDPTPVATAAPAEATSPASGSEPVSNTAGTLTLHIEADPAAIATLPPQAVLFVFARNADAPGPPVAAKRLQDVRLPLTVTLSDADRLMPTALLSATPRVEVSARFARAGSVQAEAGDLVAVPVVVELAKATPITLRLAPGDTTTTSVRPPIADQ